MMCSCVCEPQVLESLAAYNTWLVGLGAGVGATTGHMQASAASRGVGSAGQLPPGVPTATAHVDAAVNVAADALPLPLRSLDIAPPMPASATGGGTRDSASSDIAPPMPASATGGGTRGSASSDVAQAASAPRGSLLPGLQLALLPGVPACKLGAAPGAATTTHIPLASSPIPPPASGARSSSSSSAHVSGGAAEKVRVRSGAALPMPATAGGSTARVEAVAALDGGRASGGAWQALAGRPSSQRAAQTVAAAATGQQRHVLFTLLPLGLPAQ
jgi:hypothetical protein